MHLTLKTLGGVTLPDSREVRRRTIQLLGPRLLGYGFADNHGHLAVREPEAHWNQTAGTLRRILRIDGGPAIEAHVKAVREQSHCDHVARYILRQGARHGLAGHPALSPDHAFADLVGARRTRGFDPAPFFAWRRRWTPDTVFAALDLPPAGIASLARLARLPPAELVALALDAFDVSDTGARNRRGAARRTAGQLAQLAGWPTPCIREALGISKQRLSDLLREPLPDADAELLRRRVALQDTVQAQLLDAGQRWLVAHLADAGGRAIAR